MSTGYAVISPFKHTGPTHYFELEAPPPSTKSGTKTENTPAKVAAMRSMQELSKSTAEESLAVTYDELTGPGYPKGAYHKESAVSLPPNATKYSSIDHAGAPEEHIEQMPIYSTPDLTKKKKVHQKLAEEQIDKENEMPHPEAVQSISLKPSSKVRQILQSDSDDDSDARGLDSSLPPELPPRSGQKKAMSPTHEEENESSEPVSSTWSDCMHNLVILYLLYACELKLIKTMMHAHQKFSFTSKHAQSILAL